MMPHPNWAWVASLCHFQTRPQVRDGTRGRYARVLGNASHAAISHLAGAHEIGTGRARREPGSNLAARESELLTWHHELGLSPSWESEGHVHSYAPNAETR